MPADTPPDQKSPFPLVLKIRTSLAVPRTGERSRLGKIAGDDAFMLAADKGLLRVYGKVATGKFLGAEMVGPGAEHLAHLLTWARQSELTVSQILDRPHYHPVLEEGLRTALRLLNHSLEMRPMPPPLCIDCGPAPDRVALASISAPEKPTAASVPLQRGLR